MGINITGIHRVDQATAEIAVALRTANPGSADQHYYDEAQRLRDEIIVGFLAAPVYERRRVDPFAGIPGTDQDAEDYGSGRLGRSA